MSTRNGNKDGLRKFLHKQLLNIVDADTATKVIDHLLIHAFTTPQYDWEYFRDANGRVQNGTNITGDPGPTSQHRDVYRWRLATVFELVGEDEVSTPSGPMKTAAYHAKLRDAVKRSAAGTHGATAGEDG